MGEIGNDNYMSKEKSAGAVIVRFEKGKPLYLLLRYEGTGKNPKGYWDFPKGHIEEGENELQTAKREIAEETGIKDLTFLRGFRKSIVYFFQKKGKKIFKIVVFYLARTKTKDIKVSFEHLGYQWVPFNEAIQQLEFSNAKQILTQAHHFLQRASSGSSQKNPKRQGS